MTIDQILTRAPVIPVVTIADPATAVPLARALLEGGLPVIEVTLRTPAALEGLERIARDLPDALPGAGTICDPEQYRQAREAGARFAVSPGLTPALLEAARTGGLPLLPGVATASEMMAARTAGYRILKFFPAAPSGGVAALKAFAGPFPDLRFCPTGGITPESAADYLALANVLCVGGSWMLPKAALDDGDWGEIMRLARTAAALARPR